MGLTRFPEDFDKCEFARNQVIHDVLFAPNPPSITDVTHYIPQPSTNSNAKSWSTNNKSWNAWTIGALHKANEIRECKNKASGWGSQGAFQRGMLENHVYEAIKEQTSQITALTKQLVKQQKQLEIQQKLINEVWNMQDRDLGKSVKKDEWIDIAAAEI